MTRRSAIILGLLALAIGVGAYVATYRHYRPVEEQALGEDTSAPAAQPPPAAPQEEVKMRRPVIRQTESGRTAWQVRLKELKVSAGSEAISATGMREAVVYDKTGRPAIRLTAAEARGNTKDSNLEVTGNVRATSPQGALVTTDRVRWVEKERRLVCPGLVTVRTRNAAMTTRGLSYYVDDDVVKAPGLVRVYSGNNKVMGRQLVYNVRTEAYVMKKIQAVLNPPGDRQPGN